MNITETIAKAKGIVEVSCGSMFTKDDVINVLNMVEKMIQSDVEASELFRQLSDDQATTIAERIGQNIDLTEFVEVDTDHVTFRINSSNVVEIDDVNLLELEKKRYVSEVKRAITNFVL